MHKFARLLIGVLVSGILLTLSMPPVGFGWLAWFALAPVFAASVGSGLAPGFLAGVLTALVPAVLLANIPALSPLKMTGDPTWIYGGYLLFGAMFGVICAGLGESKRMSLRGAALLAAVAVLLEYGSAIVLPMNFGISQDRVESLLWVASWIGLYGVSLLLWLVNGLFVVAILDRSKLKHLLLLTPPCLVFALTPILRFETKVSGPNPKVAIIQTNSVDLQDLVAATNRNPDATLAVWPELSGGSGVIQGDAKELRVISENLKSAKFLDLDVRPAFVTTFEDGGVIPHNAAAVFRQGQESRRYWKRHPFAGEASSHTAGTEAVLADAGYPIGLNICFDSCYAATMLETARLPNIWCIALPTLDPPSSNGVVQALHAAYTPFRASELGIAIIRADTTADSMIVDRFGRIVAELGAGDGVATANVRFPRPTFYKSYGDHIWQLCVVLAVLLIIVHRKEKKPDETNVSPGSE